jgi:hypothetical protein
LATVRIPTVLSEIDGVYVQLVGKLDNEDGAVAVVLRISVNPPHFFFDQTYPFSKGGGGASGGGDPSWEGKLKAPVGAGEPFS